MKVRRCSECKRGKAWGRSPACFECLRGARLMVDGDTDEPIAHDDDGRGNGRLLFAARYRYRPVKCGKRSCRRCASGGSHLWYCYRVWTSDGKARERYVGAAGAPGPAYADAGGDW